MSEYRRRWIDRKAEELGVSAEELLEAWEQEEAFWREHIRVYINKDLSPVSVPAEALVSLAFEDFALLDLYEFREVPRVLVSSVAVVQAHFPHPEDPEDWDSRPIAVLREGCDTPEVLERLLADLESTYAELGEFVLDPQLTI